MRTVAFILDDEWNIVFSDANMWPSVDVKELDDGLLQIIKYHGPGLFSSIFYSHSRNQFSEEFYDVVAAGYGMVAHMSYTEKSPYESELVLEVQDVFHKEEPKLFFRDFHSKEVAGISQYAIVSATFIDSESLKIVYYSKDFEELTEFILIK